MSRHSTSSSPASPASSAAPRRPRPDPTAPSAPRAAAYVGQQFPEDCMIRGSGRPSLAGSESDSGRRTAVGRAMHRGGGGRALVLAEGADELAGKRQRRAREQLPDLFPEQPLGAGVGVGATAGRPPPPPGRRRPGPPPARARGRAAAPPGRPPGDTLARPEAQLAGDQRAGSGLAEPVEVGAVLAAELDHVLEARRRQQRRASRVPLQQRVGRDGDRARSGSPAPAARRRRGERGGSPQMPSD